MTSLIPVCPFDTELLRRLKGRRLVVYIHDPGLMPRVAQFFGNPAQGLHCLQVYCEEPLASVELPDDLQDVPVALYAPRLGRFRDFTRRLPLLRNLDLRVYLPNEPEENYTDIRIMSSLGIQSAISFTSGKVNWELLADLMTYSLLGLVPHAPIEPFGFIAEHYDSSRRTDFGAVYFDDPTRFLHIDGEGRVGLSRDDLEAGRYIAGSPDGLDGIEDSEEYQASRESWRNVFLRADGCASCRGWRVCLGKFSDTGGNDRGCERFFSELMEVVEQHQGLRGKKRAVWQP